MASSNKSSLQTKNHDMLETAEDLLECFETTADLLDEIEEKYIVNNEDIKDKSYTLHQFREGLDNARTLFTTLKREKWRLNKRELSVELRMGELEDYKSHLKKDMSSLNETVDILSVRIIQLENSLVESQDTIEKLEADVHHYKDLLENTQHEVKNLNKTNDGLRADLKAVKTVQDLDLLEKKFTSLEMANTILLDENKSLKNIIRSLEDSNAKNLKDGGHKANGHVVQEIDITSEIPKEKNTDKARPAGENGAVPKTKEDHSE
ncbi:hypothetical protein LOTGIDRAFT_234916 [Lottia gigantea]|uniref:Uncharacterized protein n=1 Tax=Lottia gigantea TaxID=225164 RepID=V4BFG8_LOTGI|nr:hypothetical protein LOTGIDRAFT_234916 [Lottia gigantea]ESO87664.1 hypothetical protein LOTGIDRAFT_234916 [Lottia gigantea]